MPYWPLKNVDKLKWRSRKVGEGQSATIVYTNAEVA